MGLQEVRHNLITKQHAFSEPTWESDLPFLNPTGNFNFNNWPWIHSMWVGIRDQRFFISGPFIFSLLKPWVSLSQGGPGKSPLLPLLTPTLNCFYSQHSWTKFVHKYICVCVCVCCHTNAVSLWVLTGCSTIQFNSDTMYLKLVSMPKIKSSVPQDCHAPCPSQSPSLSPVLLADQTSSNLRVPVTLLQWLSGKESACNSWRYRRCRFDPWAGKIP